MRVEAELLDENNKNHSKQKEVGLETREKKRCKQKPKRTQRATSPGAAMIHSGKLSTDGVAQQPSLSKVSRRAPYTKVGSKGTPDPLPSLLTLTPAEEFVRQQGVGLREDVVQETVQMHALSQHPRKTCQAQVAELQGEEQTAGPLKKISFEVSGQIEETGTDVVGQEEVLARWQTDEEQRVD